MLVTPRQDSFTDNMINNNMNLSPHHTRHHHHDDNNSLNNQLTEKLLTGSQKCYSPRPGHRSKLPPHIRICPPDESAILRSHFLREEELDNDVFQTPMTSFQTSSPSYSDEKHEVYSGRLYIIHHTGSTDSGSSSPSRSPTRSPSRPSPTSFPFRSSPPKFSQQWSPQTSPASSPTPKGIRKMPVFVKVYRCNFDHFAVITRDVLYSNKPVYINLRHSKVIPGDCLGRFIVAGKCDSGNVTEFEASDLSTLGQWLDAFQAYTPPASPNRIIGGSGGCGGSSSGMSSSTPPIPRSPALPTVTETDEED